MLTITWPQDNTELIWNENVAIFYNIMKSKMFLRLQPLVFETIRQPLVSLNISENIFVYVSLSFKTGSFARGYAVENENHFCFEYKL